MKKYSFIGPLFLISVWSILSYGNIIDRLLLPHPHDVLLYLFNGFFIKGFFITPLVETLKLILVSFVSGGIVGIICGMVAGYYDKAYKSFELILDFFRSLPSLLLIPLSILLFGIGRFSFFIVISWSVFVYFFINAAYGVRYGRASYRDIGKLYNISKLQEFMWIIFPSTLPSIFAGVKMGFSIALIVTIGSEMLSGHQGLGGRVIDAYMIYNTKEVFSIIVIVGSLGYIGSKLFDLAEGKVVHWRGN